MGELLDVLAEDRALAVVRAPSVADPAGAVAALAGAGMRVVEFTFTTPGVAEVIAAASAVPNALLGAGTVLTARQAAEAVEAGARFLVTPGVRAEVAREAERLGVPVMLGALTPTEVAAALDLGAAAVKIFPARAVGPAHLADLRGPFPDVPLVVTGGVDAENAGGYLAAGALAVGAGSRVVPAAALAEGRNAELAELAGAFLAAL